MTLTYTQRLRKRAMQRWRKEHRAQEAQDIDLDAYIQRIFNNQIQLIRR